MKRRFLTREQARLLKRCFEIPVLIDRDERDRYHTALELQALGFLQLIEISCSCRICASRMLGQDAYYISGWCCLYTDSAKAMHLQMWFKAQQWAARFKRRYDQKRHVSE